MADANILLAAIRSRKGACHAVLRGMLTKEVPFAVSPNVVLECALAGGATLNLSGDKHFWHPAVAAFGLRVLLPGEYLAERRLPVLYKRRPS